MYGGFAWFAGLAGVGVVCWYAVFCALVMGMRFGLVCASFGVTFSWVCMLRLC